MPEDIPTPTAVRSQTGGRCPPCVGESEGYVDHSRTLAIALVVVGVVSIDAGVLLAQTADQDLRNDALRTLKESRDLLP